MLMIAWLPMAPIASQATPVNPPTSWGRMPAIRAQVSTEAKI